VSRGRRGREPSGASRGGASAGFAFVPAPASPEHGFQQAGAAQGHEWEEPASRRPRGWLPWRNWRTRSSTRGSRRCRPVRRPQAQAIRRPRGGVEADEDDDRPRSGQSQFGRRAGQVMRTWLDSATGSEDQRPAAEWCAAAEQRRRSETGAGDSSVARSGHLQRRSAAGATPVRAPAQAMGRMSQRPVRCPTAVRSLLTWGWVAEDVDGVA
jgi:hypothetical protein